MTWWQRHLFQIRRVPCRHHNPARVGTFLDQVDDLGQLVDTLVLVVRVTVDVLSTEVTPLMTIDRTKIEFFTVTLTDRIEECLGTVTIPDLQTTATLRVS